MAAAARLDCELKSPIICHCLYLPNKIFVKIIVIVQTTDLSFLLESSTQVKFFVFHFLVTGPTVQEKKKKKGGGERGKKLGRENMLTVKKATSKESFDFVRGDKRNVVTSE